MTIIDDGTRPAADAPGPAVAASRRWKAALPAALILAFGVALVAVGGLAVHRSLTHERDAAVRAARRDAADTALAFDAHAYQVVRRLDQALVHLRGELAHHPTDFPRAVADWQDSLYEDLAFAVSAVSADGVTRFGAPPPEPAAGADWFTGPRAAAADTLFIGRPVRWGSGWRVPFSRRLSSVGGVGGGGGVGGTFAGAMVLWVDPAVLAQIQGLNIGRNGMMALIGADRLVRAHVSASPDGQSPDRASHVGMELGDLPIFDPVLPAAGTHRLTTWDGVPRIAAYRRLETYPLVAHVLLDEKEVLAGFEATRRDVLRVGALAAGGVLLATLIIAALVQRMLRHQRRLRAAQHQLADTEERWRLALEAVGDGVWDVDIRSGRSFYSHSWKAMLGYPDDEVGCDFADWKERLHPDDRDGVNAVLQRHIAGQTQHYAAEFRVRCRDGSYKWVLSRGVVVSRAADGTALRAVGTHTDITARKLAEDGLRAAAARLEAILASIPVGVAMVGANRCIAVVNPKMAQMFRLDPNAIVGASTRILYDSDEQFQEAGRHLYPVMDGGGTASEELLMRRGDGGSFWARMIGRRVSMDDPALGVVWVLDDISDRKEAEQAQRERRELFEQVFADSPAIKLLVDPADGGIVDANHSAAVFYGHPLDELRRMKVTDINMLSAEEVAQEMAHARSQERQYFLFRHRLASGEAREVEVYSNPILVQGRALLLSLIHDVTRRRQAEDALQRQTAELARSNAELEAFAYVASHDLRQPLRTVNSYLGLLAIELGDGLSADARDYMDFARDGARRMDRMIVDLLEYSRVGRKAKPFAPLPAADLIATALRTLDLAVEESGATVTVGDALPTLFGDESELVRLFQNLIGNAVKYRARDRAPVVCIDCAPAGDEGDGAPGGPFWHFTVADNGIGIAPEHFDRIFGIFQRLHARDEYEGTGVGLAVCRKVAEHHGGHIRVTSRPGEGSTFHILLPRRERPAS